MDVDEGASPRKGKGKVRAAELEEREGAARCRGCTGRKSHCWVDPAQIKKWKETVARRVALGRTPAGVVCKECSGRQQKCFLPELSKERAALKLASKRKREEEEEQAGGDREDEPQVSGSGVKAGGAGERGDEAPKKKQRVEVVVPPRLKERDAPRAAKERNSGPDIVMAVVSINNSVAALARAVMESNDYLWVMLRTVTDRVRDGCGLRKERGKRADRKSFRADGKQKDLASTRALRPRAHRCPISEKPIGQKNRGNRSWYSDWRYRRKHLSIYTNYVFHMEQVWRDREWKS